MSKSTVSDVLNGQRRDLYRPETVAKVMETAQRLGYQAHAGARMMRQKQTTAVGIATCASILNWPSVNQLSVATHRELTASGLQTVIVDAEQMVPAKSFAPFPSPDLLSGLISLDFALEKQTPNIYKVLSTRLPIVALYPVKSAEIDFVTTDRAKAMMMAVEHLVELGHSRIAFVTLPDSSPTTRAKIKGWKSACRKFQLDGKYFFELPVVQSMRDQAEYIRYKLESWRGQGSAPTALICPSDEIALWTMHRLRPGNWDIPRDLSVVGFSNVEQCEYACPPLTTVEQPVAEIARVAVERLRVLMEFNEQGNSWQAQDKLIEPRLVIRESTTQAPRRK